LWCLPPKSKSNRCALPPREPSASPIDQFCCNLHRVASAPLRSFAFSRTRATSPLRRPTFSPYLFNSLSIARRRLSAHSRPSGSVVAAQRGTTPAVHNFLLGYYQRVLRCFRFGLSESWALALAVSVGLPALRQPLDKSAEGCRPTWRKLTAPPRLAWAASSTLWSLPQ